MAASLLFMSGLRIALRPLVVLAALTSGGVVSFGLVQEAGAVAAPFAYVSLDAVEFPSGGVITGTVGCTGYTCVASGPDFIDESGMAVPGTFLVGGNGGDFVFLPDAPLPPGSYYAKANGIWSGGNATFTIVEGTDELPAISATLSVTIRGTGDLISCVEPAPGVNPQFLSKTLAQPVLGLSATGPASTQFLYDLVLAGGTPMPADRYPGSIALDTWGDEICYELFGLSYLDDEVILIGSECLSTMDLALGEIEQPFGNIDGTLAYCVIPPDGFDDDWCAYFDAALTAKSCDNFILESCFAARRACPGGDNPSFAEEDEAIAARDESEDQFIDDTGTTGDTGSTTSGDTGGTTTGGTTTGDTTGTYTSTGESTGSSTMGDDGGHASDQGGCAVGTPQREVNHWALLSLSWLLVGGLRMRRARRGG